MKKLKDIFNGSFDPEYPPFYGKAKATKISIDDKSTLLSKHASFNQYHLKSIRVQRLYKPISRIIE